MASLPDTPPGESLSRFVREVTALVALTRHSSTLAYAMYLTPETLSNRV